MERRPGRPRALTIDVIAQAALDDGIDRFSMPSVARRLGVAHSGLYRYVTDRDDLQIQAIDRAILATQWPGDDLTWDELVRAIGDAVWAACDTYPGLDRASQMAPAPAPSMLAMMVDWVAAVERQGFSAADAAVAVEFPIALAIDASTQMGRLRKMKETHADTGDLPVIEPYDNDEVWAGRGLYGRKLEIFIAGLATRRTTS